MKVKATINRLVDKQDSSIKAVATASFDGYFAVHGIKVCKGEKGLFVSMPSASYTAQNGEKKYQDIFHPVTKGAREALNTAVIGAYKQAIEMSHKEGVEVQDTPEDENEDMSDDEEPAMGAMMQ